MFPPLLRTLTGGTAEVEWENRDWRAERERGGTELVVMAGRGLRAGMAVTDAGWVSAGLAWAGRSREGEQRGECSDPVPGCILPCAAPPPTREPQSQQWVINTSPGHSHHSGFITLFSALILLLSADTALYWG